MFQENAFENVCKMAAILFRPEQNGRHLADIFKYILFEIFFFCILILILF